MNSDNSYRAYIKDCLELNQKPKITIPIKDATYGEDLLANMSSTFEAYDKIPSEVKNGDVFCLFKPNGKVIYQGIITQIEDLTITCDQITSLFRGSWFYIFEEKNSLEEEIYTILKRFMKGQIGDVVTSLPQANYENWKLKKLYLVKSGSKYKQYYINRLGNGSESEPYKYQMDRLKGEVKDGQTISYDLSSFEFANTTDNLMVRKFNQFNLTFEASQTIHLTSSDDDHEIIDVEEFIHSLYESYGVVVDINIPHGSGCSINIKTPNYEGTKIAMNSKSILNIYPRKETAEYNKLVIMYSNGAYRKSFFSTEDGIKGSSTVDKRPSIVNTKIIYSDDNLDDLKSEYLKDLITNHEVSFELYFDSNLYNWESWKLGMPLEVYYKNEVFNSCYTKYEARLSKDSYTVDITCGIVRSKLTDKINKKSTAVSAKNGSNARVGGGGVSQTNVQADWNETNPSSGAYIKNKPNTPATQVQSDWNVTDTTSPAYIKNKPTIYTGKWSLLWTNSTPYGTQMSAQTISLSGLNNYSTILLVIFPGSNPGGALSSDTPSYIVLPNIIGGYKVLVGRTRTYTIQANALKVSDESSGPYNGFGILWKIYAC